MGTGFVMDSSKTSFAEVPVLLTHRVSAGDKPALSQLLQGLRQPAQALSHNREGKGQNQTLGKRAGAGGGRKEKEQQTYRPFYQMLHARQTNFTFAVI